MTTFTTQDREEAQRMPLPEPVAHDKAIEALRIVLESVKQEYGETSNMTEELANAFILLAQLHDCSVLTSKPLNKWLAPKPLPDDQCIDMLVAVCKPGAEGGVKQYLTAPEMAIKFARAIERAHGIGE
jgi:hypothetical protein